MKKTILTISLIGLGFTLSEIKNISKAWIKRKGISNILKENLDEQLKVLNELKEGNEWNQEKFNQWVDLVREGQYYSAMCDGIDEVIFG